MSRWRAPRVAAVAGMGLGLALASALAIAIYTGFGQGEAARVRLRYGVVILPVSQVEERGGRRVQVESLDDLGRLAQRNGSVIFAQKQTAQHALLHHRRRNDGRVHAAGDFQARGGKSRSGPAGEHLGSPNGVLTHPGCFAVISC